MSFFESIAPGNRRDEIAWTGDNLDELQGAFGAIAPPNLDGVIEVFVNPRWVNVHRGDLVFRDAAGNIHVEKTTAKIQI